LKGEYGATAAPVNVELQTRVLDGAEAITCRPADVLADEMDALTSELTQLAAEKNVALADEQIDDVLTYALFPQIGLKFLENRNNPEAFEPVPTGELPAQEQAPVASSAEGEPEAYSVSVDGKVYEVIVAPSGELTSVTTSAPKDEATVSHTAVTGSETLNAPLAGNIFKVLVSPGSQVQEGDVVIIMEAMKMETEIRAASTGTISTVNVKEGDSVSTGDVLLTLG
jgi:oxaloacetate decarboxylase alpha subunit